MTRTHHRKPSWPMIALGAICVAAIALSILLVGPAPASQSTVNRTAKVSRGVVQSTVSGSGNLQPASELDLGFKTSGTVTHIYVHAGQQVAAGQLLATLDPQSAEATLQQARATLESAEVGLASTEETGSSAQSAGTGSTVSAGAASLTTTRATTMAPASTTPAPSTSTTPKTTTSPAAPTKSSSPSNSKSGSSGAGSGAPSEASSGAGATGGSSAASAESSISAASREANIASARATVHSDELSVQSAEEAVKDTKLVAPEDGTIASLAGQVGEVVSGGGTTRASSTASTSSSSSAGGSGAAQGSTNAGGSSSSTSTASSSGSSATGFAVLTNLSSMRLVVPLSESEIGSVHKGQIATVTIEALKGRKVAGHVGEVATLSTSNSGVVSYDVTFDLDQTESGLKPGMSATAEVVVKQAEGLNVPTSAITAGSATVVSGSKRETRRVTTGLAGNSSTIVLSGLKAGETVALPSASTARSSTGAAGAARSTRGIGGGLGGLGGGGFAGGGGLPRGGG